MDRTTRESLVLISKTFQGQMMFFCDELFVVIVNGE